MPRRGGHGAPRAGGASGGGAARGEENGAAGAGSEVGGVETAGLGAVRWRVAGGGWSALSSVSSIAMSASPREGAASGAGSRERLPSVELLVRLWEDAGGCSCGLAVALGPLRSAGVSESIGTWSAVPAGVDGREGLHRCLAHFISAICKPLCRGSDADTCPSQASSVKPREHVPSEDASPIGLAAGFLSSSVAVFSPGVSTSCPPSSSPLAVHPAWARHKTEHRRAHEQDPFKFNPWTQSKAC